MIDPVTYLIEGFIEPVHHGLRYSLCGKDDQAPGCVGFPQTGGQDQRPNAVAVICGQSHPGFHF